MQSTFVPSYDRFLAPVPCDRCERTATYTYRYRWPGAGWQELHTCNLHRKAVERKVTEPRTDGTTVSNLMRISRSAF